MKRQAIKTQGPAMRKQIGILLCCGVILAGCSNALGILGDIGLMGKADPRPPDPTPQELPNVKSIIENSTDTLFDATANAKNVFISKAVRRFDSPQISEYGACVRASMSNRAGKDTGLVTYVVTVSENRISGRRRAVPADECDRETYEALRRSN